MRNTKTLLLMLLLSCACTCQSSWSQDSSTVQPATQSTANPPGPRDNIPPGILQGSDLAKSTEYKGANKFGDDDPVSRYGLPVGGGSYIESTDGILLIP